MSTTLGGIALPDDLVWIDELSHDAVAQATQRTLGGINLIEETALAAGRPITLGAEGQWITRATLLQLRTLADSAAATHALTLRGSNYTVAFRRPALQAQPVVDFADPLASDSYTVQINLLTV